MKGRELPRRIKELVYTPDAFARSDEGDDREFYAKDRFVGHLDDGALAALERLVGKLVIERRPDVLDLMAGPDSHLPDSLVPGRAVGLGLNARELAANPDLSEWVVRDLNRDPRLPFGDAAFDVVLNTVSVDYLIHPFEVFREAGRVLRPGGLLLVVFSNRIFPGKAIRLWRQSSDQERVFIVEDYVIDNADLFEEPRLWTWQGRPRPADDRYAGIGIPSDPLYAVFAERKGGPAGRVRREPPRETVSEAERARIAHREAEVGRTLRCPHCASPLPLWKVPETPFGGWGAEYLRVCFNDACPYLIRNWDSMAEQGNLGCSLRFMYDPERDRCGSLPIPNLTAFRASIVES
jgi:SAM-dependent methyltransferase